MKELIILIIIAIIGGAFWFYYFFIPKDNNNNNKDNSTAAEVAQEDVVAAGEGNSLEIVTEKGDINQVETMVAPLDKAKERITKKPFGIYITRENSPVKPERFSGYHAGTDFEIFANELNTDVPVKSICGGNILRKEIISGYGGVLIVGCKIGKESITVLYGHLNLESISKRVGDSFIAGEVIGNLGKDKSNETDGERKHLHLAIHNGLNINYSGYVFSKDNLDGWIDPCEYFCK